MDEPTLNRHLAALESADEVERSEAIRALSEAVEHVGRVVPALLCVAKNLKSGLAIAGALTKLGEAAIEPIHQAWTTSSLEGRMYLAIGLAGIARTSDAALTAFLRCLGRPEMPWHLGLWAIGELGYDRLQALSLAANQAESHQAAVYASAVLNSQGFSVFAMFELGILEAIDRGKLAQTIGRPGTTAYICALDHPEPAVRAHAAILVGRWWRHRPETDGAEQMRNLVRKHPGLEPAMLSEILAESQELRGRSNLLLEALGRRAEDSDPRVRRCAQTALFSIKRGEMDLNPQIMEALDDLDPTVRELAIDGLYWLKERAAPAIPALVRALEDASTNVRAAALFSLARIPGAASQAVPQLLRLLGDPQKRLAERAALALGSVRAVPEIVIPAIIGKLEQRERYDGFNLYHVLEQYGTASVLAIPTLLADLCSVDKMRRGDAARALGFVCGSVDDADPAYREPVGRAIEAILEDPDSGVRHLAILSLNAVDPPKAIAWIRPRLHDEKLAVRKNAYTALAGRWWIPRKELLADMMEALADPDSAVRNNVCHGLLRFRSAELRGILERAREDPRPMVCEAVEKLIREIDARDEEDKDAE